MKNFFFPLSFGICLLGISFLFCQCSDSSKNTAKEPVKMLNAPQNTPSPQPLTEPKIAIPEDMKVIALENINLDQDPMEEQILLLQPKGNLSLPIQVMVAAYDSSHKTYFMAWSGAGLARGNQPFNYTVDDIVGDHQKEIALIGLDDSGHPCMNIWRRVPTPSNLGFMFKTVFEKAVQGTIDILKTPRSSAYEAGQSNDTSFAIQVDEQDSSNSNMKIRSIYQWKSQTSMFDKASETKMAILKETDERLQKIFDGDSKTLENYLSGPWYKEIPDQNDKAIIFFSAQDREISFATSRAQEVYEWETSSRTMKNGLFIMGSNLMISLIKLQVSVAITAQDTIDVNVQDEPAWSGTFKRLPDSVLTVMEDQRSAALTQIKGPSGLYKDEQGNEVRFELPLISLKNETETTDWAGSTYTLNGLNILQMKPLKGIRTSIAYQFSLTEGKTPNRIIRSLILQKGTLTSDGWRSDFSTPWKLEQMEMFTTSDQ